MTYSNWRLSPSAFLSLSPDPCSLFPCSSAGTNGLVTYGVSGEDGFIIHPETGVISTTKALDRETQEYYSLTGTVFAPSKTRQGKDGLVWLCTAGAHLQDNGKKTGSLALATEACNVDVEIASIHFLLIYDCYDWYRSFSIVFGFSCIFRS